MFESFKVMKIMIVLMIFMLFGMFSQIDLCAQYSSGDIASNFTCLDMDNNTVNLYDYSGYAIMLNFFTNT